MNVLRNYFSSKKTILLLTFAFILIITTKQTTILTSCHYSCKTCLQHSYEKCLECNEGYYYEQLTNNFNITTTSLNQNNIKEYGLCAGHVSLQYNPLGMISLAVYIFLFWAKSKLKKSQSIFFTINWIQSLSMLAFLPIPIFQPLSFVFQSFTSFMFASMVSKLYKLTTTSQPLIQAHQYRLQRFLLTQNVAINIYFLGPLIVMIILYIVLIPLFLYLRKCICGQDKCRKLSQNILKKIEMLGYITYFFLIQETYIILFVGLKYNTSKQSAIFLVLFLLSNIFMVINYAIKPIPYFPNKKIQFISISQKILMPLLLVFDSEVYLIGIPTILFVTKILEGFLNNKQYNLKPNEKTKYFGYLAMVVLIVFLTALFILLQRAKQNAYGARITSYFITAIIMIFYGATFGVEIFEVIYDYLKQQKQQQRMRNTLIREQSTNMNFTTTYPTQEEPLAKSQLGIELQINNSNFIQNNNDIDSNQRQCPSSPVSSNKRKRYNLDLENVKTLGKPMSSKKLMEKSDNDMSEDEQNREMENALHARNISLSIQNNVNKSQVYDPSVMGNTRQLVIGKNSNNQDEIQSAFTQKLESGQRLNSKQYYRNIQKEGNNEQKQELEQQQNKGQEQVQIQKQSEEQRRKSKKHKSSNSRNSRGSRNQKNRAILEEKYEKVLQNNKSIQYGQSNRNQNYANKDTNVDQIQESKNKQIFCIEKSNNQLVEKINISRNEQQGNMSNEGMNKNNSTSNNSQNDNLSLWKLNLNGTFNPSGNQSLQYTFNPSPSPNQNQISNPNPSPSPISNSSTNENLGIIVVPFQQLLKQSNNNQTNDNKNLTGSNNQQINEMSDQFIDLDVYSINENNNQDIEITNENENKRVCHDIGQNQNQNQNQNEHNQKIIPGKSQIIAELNQQSPLTQ